MMAAVHWFTKWHLYIFQISIRFCIILVLAISIENISTIFFRYIDYCIVFHGFMVVIPFSLLTNFNLYYWYYHHICISGLWVASWSSVHWNWEKLVKFRLVIHEMTAAFAALMVLPVVNEDHKQILAGRFPNRFFFVYCILLVCLFCKQIFLEVILCVNVFVYVFVNGKEKWWITSLCSCVVGLHFLTSYLAWHITVNNKLNSYFYQIELHLFIYGSFFFSLNLQGRSCAFWVTVKVF